MEHPSSRLAIGIGPLHYEFTAHDPWGQGLLESLRNNLDCVCSGAPCDRVVHLVQFRPTRTDFLEIGAHRLPDSLAAILPSHLPQTGWRTSGDPMELLCWSHEQSQHAIATPHDRPRVQPAPFHLPWQLILRDIVRMGGGLLHGGLALFEKQGFLFTAPPGGGKTTTMSRLPAPWQVLADDAALVWPVSGSEFRASPLPTWSLLLGRSRVLPAIKHWQVGRVTDLAGILLLCKARHDRISTLPPIEAAQQLYRALSEHPGVVPSRRPLRGQLFHTACDLARALPCWELELTRNGSFWEELRENVLSSTSPHST